tara:strand:+ start:47 stop:640 length:594 start_codon:yes stop_codon:yes gene_type:complete
MPIQRVKPKFSHVKDVSILHASLPAGSIVKTETTPFTDFGTINMTTTANETLIPGTEISFTRSLSNSKILVQYNLKMTSYLTIYLNMQRKIGSGSYATISTGASGTQNSRTSNRQVLGAYYNYTSVNAMGYGIHSDFYQFLDSTSTGLTDTTDAITYKITGYASVAGYDVMLNIDGYDGTNYNSTAESSVTFMEIKV